MGPADQILFELLPRDLCFVVRSYVTFVIVEHAKLEGTEETLIFFNNFLGMCPKHGENSLDPQKAERRFRVLFEEHGHKLRKKSQTLFLDELWLQGKFLLLRGWTEVKPGQWCLDSVFSPNENKYSVLTDIYSTRILTATSTVLMETSVAQVFVSECHKIFFSTTMSSDIFRYGCDIPIVQRHCGESNGWRSWCLWKRFLVFISKKLIFLDIDSQTEIVGNIPEESTDAPVEEEWQFLPTNNFLYVKLGTNIFVYS